MQVGCNIVSSDMDAAAWLKKFNLKVTTPRKAVLMVLSENSAPLEVLEIEQLVNKKSSINKVTVYRILETFRKNKMVEKIELQEGKFHYELAGNHHHHLICDNCGVISDIEDCHLEALEHKAETENGFKITKHIMEYFGLCKKCQRFT